jgi:hypothetical protein
MTAANAVPEFKPETVIVIWERLIAPNEMPKGTGGKINIGSLFGSVSHNLARVLEFVLERATFCSSMANVGILR